MLTLAKFTGWILATLPRQFAHLLSVLLGDLIYFFPSSHRRTLLSNFHHVFPEKPISWRQAKARISCRRLVEKTLFNFALPFFTEGRLDRTLIATDESLELLKKYTNPHRAIVGVSIHNSMMEACTLIRRCLPIKTPEIGVLYQPLKLKLLDAYVRGSRMKHGITLIDKSDGLDAARELVGNKNWMILVFDQDVEDSGRLTYFLERPAMTTGIPQLLAQAYGADVLGFYGERTGFWEGNLHVEKISEGKKGESVILQANQWLEAKILTDEKFSANWMWIHNRWKAQSHVSQNLSLNYPKDLVKESKDFYRWESIPRKNRIWFRMPNHLGEIVKWLPFIKAVRNSRLDAEITLLVNRNFSPLLEAFQIADKIIRIPKRNAKYFWRFQELRGSFPDTYYQLTNSVKADFEARLVNAPRRYGFRWPSTSRPLLTDTFDVDPGWDERKNHQSDLWYDFLRHFGLRGDVDFEPLKVSPGFEVINPLRCLQTESHDAPYFGLISGAGNHPEKCWPTDSWVECVAGLMDIYPNGNICLFGTTADLPASRKIIEQFEPGSIHDFTGSTTLMQFVMALKSCSLVISNDCGGLHLANALGVASVGLYGPTNPIYSKPVFDAPLGIVQPANCPNHGGGSTDMIYLTQVFEAITGLVKQPESAPKEVEFVHLGS